MMKKRMICLVFALLAILCVIEPAAAADEAGNVFVSGSDPEELTVERDLYWAGGTRTFTGYSIGKSLLAAGWDIIVSDTEAGGSVRAAGYKVRLSDVNAADNITVAAYDINLYGTTASGVYLAGNRVFFRGTADCVSISAGDVYLDGNIAGDATIYGGKVQLGEGLHVDGTLTVHSKQEVLVPVNAKIAKLITDPSNPPVPIEVTIGEYTADYPTVVRIRKIVFGVLGAMLAGALICALPGGGEIRKAGERLTEQLGWVMLSGALGLIVLSLILLLLLHSRFDLPDGDMLTLLVYATIFYCPVFTGAALANALLPRLTNNRVLNNELVCSVIGAAVFRLPREIPVFGVIFVIVTIILTLGVVILGSLRRLYFVFSGEEW